MAYVVTVWPATTRWCMTHNSRDSRAEGNNNKKTTQFFALHQNSVFGKQILKMANKELKEYEADEVFKHTSADDCWLVIGNESNGGYKMMTEMFSVGNVTRLSVTQTTCDWLELV